MKSIFQLIFLFLLFLAFNAHAQSEVVGNEIILGQSASFSGSFAEQAASYRDGALLYFNEVNRRGGIHGRKIRLVSLDDKYKVDLMLANTRKLLDEEKVFALALYTWTPMARAAIPVATGKKVPFFAPYTGADDVYQSDSRYVYTIRASFHAEMDTIVRHLATIGMHRLALVRYSSKTGEELRADLLPLLKKYGADLVGEGTMVINTADTVAAVKQLAPVDAQAIIIGVSGSDAVSFIQRYEATTGKKNAYYARSLVGTRQLVKELGDQAFGISITQLVPNPFKQTMPVTQEYMRLQVEKNAAAAPDFISLEGFIAARVLCKALERAGPKLTRQGFLDAMSHLGRTDIGGFEVNFTPERRNGSEYVGLTMIGRNGRIVD